MDMQLYKNYMFTILERSEERGVDVREEAGRVTKSYQVQSRGWGFKFWSFYNNVTIECH